MELSHEDILKNLQLEYDKQVTRLREDLQRQARVRGAGVDGVKRGEEWGRSM